MEVIKVLEENLLEMIIIDTSKMEKQIEIIENKIKKIYKKEGRFWRNMGWI